MKKLLIFLLVVVAILSTVCLVLVKQDLQEAEKKIATLEIPEANSTNQQIGIVYVLGSSKVYESFDDAFQVKEENGKVAQADILSQIVSMGRLCYLNERIYGIKYDRVLTQELPGTKTKTVYQVGELFIVPDNTK